MAQQTQKPETFLLSPGAESSLPQQAQIALQQVDNLKYFLISAPVDWIPDQCIRRFLLPTGEYVSCVLWNNLFHISGTDIVRCLAFRFQAFGRPVKNTKKFEEGIFSDLRNLKAGTDASLEDPKSPFLDFLYKNNCIRTQKKQKVFYWYSVPHDRLFLDALERDLKREKMGQESTTMAVSEPALSFEFDATQSLFEQLTKAQQSNTSTFVGHNQQHHHHHEYTHSASPAVRAADSMPPPQMVSHTAQPVSDDALNDMSSYSQMTMPMPANPTATPAPMTTAMKHNSYSSPMYYDRNGTPMSYPTNTHNSVQGYVESSPAPSFVSSQSHYDDYSTRGVSYEPVTPPQQQHHQYSHEPAYVPTDDGRYYSPDVTTPFNQTSYFPSQHGAIQYSHPPKTYDSAPMFGHVQGSPTYKQRRRHSSLTQTYAAVTAPVPQIPRIPHSVHRPSDLRRSVSVSVVPMAERQVERAASGPPMQYSHMHSFHPTPDVSRQATPLPTVEGRQQSVPLHSERYNSIMSEGFGESMPGSAEHHGPGVFRRARSATANDSSPYPHKAHSCPIPTCGRQFKRLEHLKRHVRTHTQDRPYICSICNKTFSRSDNLAQHRRTHDGQGSDPYATNYDDDVENIEEDEGEEDDDQFVNYGQTSPGTPEHNYLQGPGGVMQSPVPTAPADYTMGTNMPPPPIPMSVPGY